MAKLPNRFASMFDDDDDGGSCRFVDVSLSVCVYMLKVAKLENQQISFFTTTKRTANEDDVGEEKWKKESQI